MMFKFNGCIALAVVVMVATPALGVPVTQKDSASFNIQEFEGDAFTSPSLSTDWTTDITGNALLSTDGDILTWDTQTSPDSNVRAAWIATGGSAWVGTASNSVGFTLEFRAQIMSQETAGTGPQETPLSASPNAGVGRYDIFVGASSVMQRRNDNAGSGTSENIIDTSDNTDGFHVFRIAREPGAGGTIGRASYWRDGVLLAGDVIGLEQVNGLGFSFGEQTAAANGIVKLDYMRMDTTGAFAPTPIPEPNALVLLILGAMPVLLSRRGRKS